MYMGGWLALKSCALHRISRKPADSDQVTQFEAVGDLDAEWVAGIFSKFRSLLVWVNFAGAASRARVVRMHCCGGLLIQHHETAGIAKKLNSKMNVDAILPSTAVSVSRANARPDIAGSSSHALLK